MDQDKEDPRYFQSYSTSGIHEEMIKDSVRTKGYRQAMLGNKNLFRDKIVLDVGCGTGILSLFAADAGAKHVYAIDNSNVIDIATKIIENNNYSSKITLIKSRVEDAELPVASVDIIVSEWMGYCLLYESMLESVIFARDKWLVIFFLILAPKGLMFPDVASLFIAGIEDEDFRDQKVDWWVNVYGYNMSPMREIAISEPVVDVVQKDALVTAEGLVKRIDLSTVTAEDVRTLETDLTLCCKRQDFIHAMILFFNVQFTRCHKPIVISTSLY
ncbi:Protein arginine N-methyltransferase 1 [Thelohanellus kitauei]|uniref:type I protein arginine methyltransferase n=1 Tax=Thelohanellus kitauei TaxID=669202 RepID=A0A0C2N2V8_THEKT|nr:Protein arginine N-methyltransferase 1 [Thelohanellus kitauei]